MCSGNDARAYAARCRGAVEAAFESALARGAAHELPLDHQCARVLERDGYRVESLIFASAPGVPVIATIAADAAISCTCFPRLPPATLNGFHIYIIAKHMCWASVMPAHWAGNREPIPAHARQCSRARAGGPPPPRALGHGQGCRRLPGRFTATRSCRVCGADVRPDQSGRARSVYDGAASLCRHTANCALDPFHFSSSFSPPPLL